MRKLTFITGLASIVLLGSFLIPTLSQYNQTITINNTIETDAKPDFKKDAVGFVEVMSKMLHDEKSSVYKYFNGNGVKTNNSTGEKYIEDKSSVRKPIKTSLNSTGANYAPFIEADLIAADKDEVNYPGFNYVKNCSFRIYLNGFCNDFTDENGNTVVGTKYNMYNIIYSNEDVTQYKTGVVISEVYKYCEFGFGQNPVVSFGSTKVEASKSGLTNGNDTVTLSGTLASVTETVISNWTPDNGNLCSLSILSVNNKTYSNFYTAKKWTNYESSSSLHNVTNSLKAAQAVEKLSHTSGTAFNNVLTSHWILYTDTFYQDNTYYGNLANEIMTELRKYCDVQYFKVSFRSSLTGHYSFTILFTESDISKVYDGQKINDCYRLSTDGSVYLSSGTCEIENNDRGATLRTFAMVTEYTIFD